MLYAHCKEFFQLSTFGATVVQQRIGGQCGDFAQCASDSLIVHAFFLVGLHHVREAQQYAVPILRFGYAQGHGGLGHLCAICSQIVHIEVARYRCRRILDSDGKVGLAALQLGSQNVAHIYFVGA